MSENGKKDKVRQKKKPQYGLSMSIVAAALLIFMCLYIPTGPLKKYKEARRDVQDLRTQLGLVLKQKHNEEIRLRNQEPLMDRLKQRDPNFHLYGFLSGILTELKMGEKADLKQYTPRGEKPDSVSQVSMVQLVMNDVTLSSLLDFLHKAYSGNNLVVLYRLEHIKPSKDGLIDCNIVFLSPNAAKA